MKPLSWHRLDNIFGILNFQILTLHFSKIDNNSAIETLRWVLLVVTLWCQEKAPWQIEYTIIPVAMGVILMIATWVLPSEWESFTIDGKKAITGFLFGCIAVYFFVKGLDDQNDW
eukprot:TRINITY_DN3379_c0_g1_i1.p1 TRINITY_DN3379_c0_g1~~TRINITY_DN3379_c0_g1_i1.p1  ORF type:complete len:115 (+),score=7.70 TRINITY_DN3379_c0_g1_i1:263-607(+)